MRWVDANKAATLARQFAIAGDTVEQISAFVGLPPDQVAPIVEQVKEEGLMNASPALVTRSSPALEVGRFGDADIPVMLDLDMLLSGRLLIQGSSGAGKSRTLRRIVEEAFEYVTVMIVDPEGEFGSLAAHIGATTLRADGLSPEALTEAALRARRHRVALHIDLSDLDAEELILKAAAFFEGLMAAPPEHWGNTCLVCADEAHLLAPHVAANARDAETRRIGVAALNDLCARGRKRGIGAVIASPRLATLASSVVATLRNVLIGLNMFDRDVIRAAQILGLNSAKADRLRRLAPGDFFAYGPALSWTPRLIRIGESVTVHDGATPDVVGPAELTLDEAAKLLDLAALNDSSGTVAAPEPGKRAAGRALDLFLLDPRAAAACRIIEAVRRIAPNATTDGELAAHLALDPDQVAGALDLLSGLGAADTIARGGARIVRLSARMRLRAIDAPLVSLS